MEQPHDDAIAALRWRASLADANSKIAALEHGDKFASIAQVDRCAARVDELDAATLDHSRKLAALEQAHGIASVKFGAMQDAITALRDMISDHAVQLASLRQALADAEEAHTTAVDRLTRLGGILTERVEALEDERRSTTVVINL
jgi:chromosome segregation ATPase